MALADVWKKVHRGIRRYACEQCGARFSRQDTLVRYVRRILVFTVIIVHIANMLELVGMYQMGADVVGDSATLPGGLGKVVLPAGTIYHKRGSSGSKPLNGEAHTTDT